MDVPCKTGTRLPKPTKALPLNALLGRSSNKDGFTSTGAVVTRPVFGTYVDTAELAYFVFDRPRSNLADVDVTSVDAIGI